MKKDDIIKKVNTRYIEKKMMKFPYTAPELLPAGIQSDQIKAVVEIFAEILEELTEKSSAVANIDFDSPEDFEFKKKVVDLHRKLHGEE